MKFYRNAIILVVVLGLLIGAYFFINNKKTTTTTENSTTEESTTINVISVDSTKINQITIKNKDGLLDFTKVKTEWNLKTPSDLKTNKDSVSSVMSSITNLIAEKVIEEKTTNISQYGFDTANCEIVITTSDNKTQVLELGSKTPTQDGYYLLDKLTGKVFTIQVYNGDQLIDAKFQIRDKTLFTYKTDDVTGVSMDRDGKLLFTAKILADKTWALTAPIENNANLDAISSIVYAFSTLTISNFIEDNAADLSKYGLENPKYAVEIDTKTGKNRILLGNTSINQGDIYAILEGSKDVFDLSDSTLTFLDKPFNEIIEQFAYIPNIADVSKVEVAMDGKSDTSIIQTDKGDEKTEADSEKDKFTFNGIDATGKDKNDDQPFRVYYQALIGIHFDSIEIGAVPKGTPEIVIDYTLNISPGKVKLEFISKDKEYYYVLKNGKYINMLVLKSQFDKENGVRSSNKNLIDFLKTK